MRKLPLATLLIAALPRAAGQAPTLDGVLRQMDKAAASFQALSAHARIVKYTAIVKDESVEEGTIWVKRVRPRVTHLLLEFSSPERYYVRLADRKAEIYRPKIATLEEYDVGKYRNLVDQLWLLSFGAAGRDVASRYKATLKGEDPVAGKPALRLELVPKSSELVQHVPRIDMWISTELWQPVQQKFYEVSAGDYRLYTYTDVKWNPTLAEGQLRLKPAPGTKRVQPGK